MKYLSAAPLEGYECHIFDEPEFLNMCAVHDCELWRRDEPHDGTIVLTGLPNDPYHGGPGISSSHVKDALTMSMRAWHHKHVQGYREPKSAAVVDGQALHALIEDPSNRLFKNGFLVLPEFIERADKKGNVKQIKVTLSTPEVKPEIQRAADEGKEILKVNGDSSSAGYYLLQDLANSLRRYSWARKILEDERTLFEASVFVRDDETDLWLKCRPDAWIPGQEIDDWKSTVDAMADPFGKTAGKFGYHISAAMYLAITGEKEFYLCAGQKSVPFEWVRYGLQWFDLELAFKRYREGLLRIAECYHSNKWPALHSKTLHLPPWRI